MNTYKAPKDDYFLERIQALDMLYTAYVNQYEPGLILESDKHMDELIDCIVRVHQREHYYNVFHEMTNDVSEVESIALYSYWILKYNPFRTTLQSYETHKAGEKLGSGGEKGEDKWEWCAQYFNERFCLYMLTNVLRKNYGEQRLPLSDRATNNLLYSLKHHDISEEAMVDMFELIEDMVDQTSIRYEKIPTQKV